ncbi:Protein 4.1 [Bagarius yarrelli]|uniref:Protein 4.1 n=1 Tax=Bagarius yarrelli TaxID=175774 RepID=A0A556U8K0_BAGYA|nr:Protein 4.1 [Bagarius yarrelli]
MTTDKANSGQKKQVCEHQQEDGEAAVQEPDAIEPFQDEPASAPLTLIQHPKSHQSTSAGRGLSRLFSSLLKRRSQCSEDEGVKMEQGQGKESHQHSKAPIADPEPELRIEGDAALDQHSISSTENQVGLDQRDSKDELKAGKREKKEKKHKKDDMNKNKDKKKKLEKVRKEKRNKDKVKTEEGKKEIEIEEDEVHPHAEEEKTGAGKRVEEREKGRKEKCEEEVKALKAKHSLSRCLIDMARLYEGDSTASARYFLCLQLRKDILSGRLPCSFVTLALLGSYALQSELGEYDPEVHGTDYAKELRLIPNQTKELEDKVMELHRTYRSMSPAQADMLFLENAKKLSMYGVDLHQAKDLSGVDIMLGVCSGGLMVYKDKLRINRFPWPKVLKVSYKRSSFFIKIRPSELEHYESDIGFKVPSYKASKKLWKVCVEHHTFFRLTSTEAATTPRKLLALGSKFRYSGRTQAQTRQASSMINRPAPHFKRFASKTASHSLDGAMVSTFNKAVRPVSAPIMSPISIGDAASSPMMTSTIQVEHHNLGTPTSPPSHSGKKKLEVNAESCVTGTLKTQSIALKDTPEIKKRAKKLEGETLYTRHSNLMLEDLDKTQSGIMRHHSSISELKRSFMESVPEPRPSEWDKRLSTQSPFRTANINGQMQPDVTPTVKTHTFTVSEVSNSPISETATKESPIVQTKTITYESVQPDENVGVLLNAQTITSETLSTTTTTQITKMVKGGISETRIEKRIVITGDSEIDHDKALAQAIKEAKEQHPDMSVTKVVVHQETEITPE